MTSGALQRALPPHVLERVRVARLGEVGSGAGGVGPVLYWMRSALRGHENPALDAAASAANSLGAPLLVLLQVEDQYAHATARRQMFLLQGAREAQEEMRRRGFHVHVQVDRKQCREAVAATLAKQASLVVAEEPFVAPWLHGLEALLKVPFKAPVWAVDCSSVVPSALVPKNSCHRAYSFEQATRQLHAERIRRPWEDVPLQVTSKPSVTTGCASTDLASADLAALVRDMDVDMSVPPVQHTIGGSPTGYARWRNWIAAGGLKTYAARRNDALDPHAVSRMSGYLNVGMVSPMRIAREASASSGAGKSKFLHEFLTWRGVAYAHFYHFRMPATGATLAQLPAWAQETLRRHAGDRRNVVSRDRLLVGKSGDRAWDGMQTYLVATGELHNNARMGWGKAIPKWAASPEEAVDLLVELNNRFALDGHAPPSYAGVLGSLGLFEGPKSESPIMGKVAWKPPKAKYAALPTKIDALEASSGVVGDAAQTFPKAASALEQHVANQDSAPVAFPERGRTSQTATVGETEEGQRNVRRRWVRKLPGDSGAVIDLR